MAVLNAGIGGNRVLSEGAFNAGLNALARLSVRARPDRCDALIVLEGINDIGSARTESDAHAGGHHRRHEQMIERAHTRG